MSGTLPVGSSPEPNAEMAEFEAAAEAALEAPRIRAQAERQLHIKGIGERVIVAVQFLEQKVGTQTHTTEECRDDFNSSLNQMIRTLALCHLSGKDNDLKVKLTTFFTALSVPTEWIFQQHTAPELLKKSYHIEAGRFYIRSLTAEEQAQFDREQADFDFLNPIIQAREQALIGPLQYSPQQELDTDQAPAASHLAEDSP